MLWSKALSGCPMQVRVTGALFSVSGLKAVGNHSPGPGGQASLPQRQPLRVAQQRPCL